MQCLNLGTVDVAAVIGNYLAGNPPFGAKEYYGIIHELHAPKFPMTISLAFTQDCDAIEFKVDNV